MVLLEKLLVSCRRFVGLEPLILVDSRRLVDSISLHPSKDRTNGGRLVVLPGALKVGCGRAKEEAAATGGHASDDRGTRGCCDPYENPGSHDTSRIARAKLMARMGEEFRLECPHCGGDIRLIGFITDPGPMRKILTHLGEPLARRRRVPSLGSLALASVRHPPAIYRKNVALTWIRDGGRLTNLITTLESGMHAGTVSVWNMQDICDCSMHHHHGMAGMAAMSMSDGDGPAMPVAAYRPFAGRRPVHLATTYQSGPGGRAQPVIAAWRTQQEVAFTAFGLDNEPQTLKRRV